MPQPTVRESICPLATTVVGSLYSYFLYYNRLELSNPFIVHKGSSRTIQNFMFPPAWATTTYTIRKSGTMSESMIFLVQAPKHPRSASPGFGYGMVCVTRQCKISFSLGTHNIYYHRKQEKDRSKFSWGSPNTLGHEVVLCRKEQHNF